MNHSKEIAETIAKVAQEARRAARLLVRSSAEERSASLRAMARELLNQQESIIKANSIDLKAAEENGISGAMLNRLDLGKDGIEKFIKVPCRYADMQRMVGHILKNNSENVVNSCPFITANILWKIRYDSA